MTFISWYFLAFVLGAAAVYYVFPISWRWTVLLAASILFYAQAGWTMLAATMVSACYTWVMGLAITKTCQGRKRRGLVWCAIGGLIGLLAACKVAVHVPAISGSVIVPVGISYYTFSSVGYLADIYWKKEEAQKNPFRFLLFILYFPKVMQGPIEKYRTFSGQLAKGRRISYENITYGIQLIAWGFFKKLVVSNRAAIYTSEIQMDLDKILVRGGCYTLWVVVLSVIELYFDFSGYMDIAEGISQMFGIVLTRNFRHPFLSRTAAEFWRRWHITLGLWFRDYIYLPVCTSARLARISAGIKKAYGKRAARAFLAFVPLFVVWILTGLWHGTGFQYLVWGIYWGGIITISTVFAPEFQKLSGLFPIDTGHAVWAVVQVVRTCVIYGIARIIVLCACFSDIWNVLQSILLDFRVHKAVAAFQSLGNIDLLNFFLIISGALACGLVSIYEEKRGSLRAGIAALPAIPRWVIYSLLILAPVYLGIYGTGNTSSTFAYIHF